MKAENFNISGHKPCVLVAPLDWGLGHATRCIPIIRTLLALGCRVVIAASGPQKVLLEKEFANLQLLTLPGYDIRYSNSKKGFSWKIFLQLPKIWRTLAQEHRWLKNAIQEYAIDAVISDNRPGLYCKDVPSVYITHQLTIKTGNLFTQWIAQRLHYHFINKFRTCWVPDSGGDINLGGSLSHPDRLPKIPVWYLGPLSRFENNVTEKKYDLAVIISGPEPQRNIFEGLLLSELKDYDGQCLFIRGLPEETATKKHTNNNIEIQNHLSVAELNRVLTGSGMILSRCGYTTLMDLVKLQKKAILVPTPGQTEQEYLAKRLMENKLFYCTSQDGFSLKEALQNSDGFSYDRPFFDEMKYTPVIKTFVDDLLSNTTDKTRGLPKLQ